MACDPPLQLDLAVAPQADRTVPGQPAQTKWRGLVVLRYAVNPALSGTLLDVVADVDLGPEFAEVLQVSPAAQWSPNECRLRWKLGRLEPGSSGCVRAVMAAKAGTPATRAIEALQASTVGKVVFTGWPGQALSGVGFEVAMADGDGAAADYHTGKVVTFGEVTLRP